MNRLLLHLHRKSREQKHRLFLNLLRPTPEMRILNVGASGTSIGLPEQLESFYEHLSQIIGGGISFADVQDYRDSFPGVQAVVFDGCALPFADKSFDIVYSNAVLEHLPDYEMVRRFAAEVQRVGNRVVHHHTQLLVPVRSALPFALRATAATNHAAQPGEADGQNTL